MTKKDLLEMLEPYSNNTEIVLWKWDNNGSKITYLIPTLQQPRNKKTFTLMNSRTLVPLDVLRATK